MFEQALGDGEGQGSLACYSPHGYKESDTTEQLNSNSNDPGSQSVFLLMVIAPQCSEKTLDSNVSKNLGARIVLTLKTYVGFYFMTWQNTYICTKVSLFCKWKKYLGPKWKVSLSGLVGKDVAA